MRSLAILVHIQPYCYDELTLYRNDYDTPDGTGIRDCVHVMFSTGSFIRFLRNGKTLDDNLQSRKWHSPQRIGDRKRVL